MRRNRRPEGAVRISLAAAAALVSVLVLGATLVTGGTTDSVQRVTTILTEDHVKRSLVAAGDPAPFQRLFAKIRTGQPCTLGFIGGSITTGAKSEGHEFSWPKLVHNWFAATFPDTTFTYVNAAVGATGTDFGSHRVQKDLLDKSPDAVFVEFAVNDGRSPDCMPTLEGMLRQILKSPRHPAVAMLFTMASGGNNAQQWHAQVGNHYRLPMVSFRDAYWPDIEAGRIPWERLIADSVHPNREGHALCADLVIAQLKAMLADFPEGAPSPAPAPAGLPGPLTNDLYEYTAMYTANDLTASRNEGWSVTDEGRVARFGKGWVADKPGSVLEFELEGRVFTILFHRIKRDMGRVAVQIDGGERKVFDAWFDQTWGGYSARGAMPPCKAGVHRLRIELLDEKSAESNGHLFELQAILAAGLPAVPFRPDK